MNQLDSSATRTVRIVVVDDHAIVRRGLVDLFNDEPGLEVCGESASIAEALAVIRAQHPDVAIVDLSLGSESGMDLVSALARDHRDLRILVLSAHDERLFAERAFRAGAHGYIMKAEPADTLVQAVRQVAGGRQYASEAVADWILAALGGRNGAGGSIDRLTDRERHVLRLVGQGLETRQIAAQLSLSVKTVESHYAHMKEKLGLKTGRELVRVAVTWAEGGLS